MRTVLEAKFDMERCRVTCLFISLVVLATCIHSVKGKDNFITDFLKWFDTASPVYISTDQFDEDFGHIDLNTSVSFIRYRSSEEEEEVANYLHELNLLGDLTMVLFLNEGHQELLNILIKELYLFKKGLIGLLPESDFTNDLDKALRLDTKIYLYATFGETIVLKEAYAVNGEKITHEIGTWSEKTGLKVPTKNMWERRKSMRGMSVRVATVHTLFLHELYYDLPGTSIIGGGGFFIEPLNILASKLNFTLDLMVSKDGQWGATNNNGTWNGLVGMLIAKETDITAALLSVSEERSKVIEFGIPLLSEVITLVSPPLKPKTDPWIYLEIFPKPAWYVCGAMVTIISVCFVTINHSGINYLHHSHDSEKFTIVNSISLSMTFFRQIYYDINIKGLSTKILFMLSALSTYLLYAHYTAFLTAASTSLKDNSIRSFRDVLKGGYKVTVWEHTSNHDELKLAKPGTPMHEVFYKTMVGNPSSLVHSYEDMLETLFHSEKTLYYGSETVQLYHDSFTLLDIQG